MVAVQGPYREGDLLAGKFQLVREIGRGATGTVVLAVDMSLERDVAIKLMLTPIEGDAETQSIERFLRQARAVAKLRGNHISQVYEAGVSKDGYPYIAMEYLVGEDLDRILIKEKRLAVPRAVDFVLQACVGVAEAHARGIVHRDLKPANLFEDRTHRERPCLKVLDFGIARVSFEALQLTSGQVLGTPLYMSPEQRDLSGTVDLRTDIWSLGVILYQLLTGQVPFAAKTASALDEKVRRSIPVQPERLAPEIPKELSVVILRCLEKDPISRYGDVGELAWALAQFTPESGARLAAEVSDFLELEPARSSLGTVSLPWHQRPTPSRRDLCEPTSSASAISRLDDVGRDPSELNALDFFDEATLVEALLNRSHDGRRIAFLVGSALNAPYRGRQGIPDVEGMIRLVREHYGRRGREQFDQVMSGAGTRRYQVAFNRLLATHGLRTVNRIIRKAVLQARTTLGSYTEAALAGDRDACLGLERDTEGWVLSPGTEALGKMLADIPPRFGDLVLTSNFDPLLEVAVLRAGGRPFRTALDGDGELHPLEEHGCNIVHFHGDWWRTDTLHAPSQLSQARPRLAGALGRMLRERTLVVLGYGGWDDVFTRSLIEVVRSGDLVGHREDGLDVLWAFYSNDKAHILRKYNDLFNALAEAIGRGRILFYSGVDLHHVFSVLSTAPSTQEKTTDGPPLPTSFDATLISGQDPAQYESGTTGTRAKVADTEVDQDEKTVERG